MFIANKDVEGKLVELVSTIRNEASQWRCLHFHLSELQEHYRSPYQISIAVNLINDLLKAHQGGLFVCEDADLFLLIKNITKAQIDKVIFQLRYLFADDPLSYTFEGNDNPDFCEVMDLSVHYEMLADRVKRRSIKNLKRKLAENSVEKAQPVTGKLKPLTLSVLSRVEADLPAIDLTRAMRRQPICAAVAGSSNVRRVFDELYVNIAHLRVMLGLDADLLGERALFKYLTQLLDNRILTLLAAQGARLLDRPASLNLNVETLLSQHFTQFDAHIKPSVKVSIVIEINVADVFSDMTAFEAARDKVQRMGYRVCLDGLSSKSFMQLDRSHLGFDLAKLQWNADIASDLQTEENRELVNAVKKCGANRIILCRCDNKQAVEYGQVLGISLFQGRYLDSLIDPHATIEN